MTETCRDTGPQGRVGVSPEAMRHLGRQRASPEGICELFQTESLAKSDVQQLPGYGTNQAWKGLQGSTAPHFKAPVQAPGHCWKEALRQLASAWGPSCLAGWEMRATPGCVGMQRVCARPPGAGAVLQGSSSDRSHLRYQRKPPTMSEKMH